MQQNEKNCANICECRRKMLQRVILSLQISSRIEILWIKMKHIVSLLQQPFHSVIVFVEVCFLVLYIALMLVSAYDKC